MCAAQSMTVSDKSSSHHTLTDAVLAYRLLYKASAASKEAAQLAHISKTFQQTAMAHAHRKYTPVHGSARDSPNSDSTNSSPIPKPYMAVCKAQRMLPQIGNTDLQRLRETSLLCMNTTVKICGFLDFLQGPVSIPEPVPRRQLMLPGIAQGCPQHFGGGGCETLSG